MKPDIYLHCQRERDRERKREREVRKLVEKIRLD